MKSKKKSKTKIVPVIAIIIIASVFIVLVMCSGQPLTVDTILKYTPESELLAVGILFTFFALKSLTVVFPLTILYMASGIIFEPTKAVLVSTIGLAITITIPYIIGRYAGSEVVHEICSKYPKARMVSEYMEHNVSFACFITRFVGFLPGDIVSLYFGACEVAYPKYLLNGIFGSLLSITADTLLGDKLSDPSSKAFLIILTCRIAVTVGAFLINLYLNRSEIARLRKEQNSKM